MTSVKGSVFAAIPRLLAESASNLTSPAGQSQLAAAPAGLGALFADGYVGPAASALPLDGRALEGLLGAVGQLLSELAGLQAPSAAAQRALGVDGATPPPGSEPPPAAPATPQPPAGRRVRPRRGLGRKFQPDQPAAPSAPPRPPTAGVDPQPPAGTPPSASPRPPSTPADPPPAPPSSTPPSQTEPPSRTEPPPGEPAKQDKAWDVFFDAREGTKTKQQSPIVLDLNRNGKPDITGKNIKGDGKLNGGVEGFDLNPSKRQWENRSIMRRPGRGAPSLPRGARMEIYDKQGKRVASKQANDKVAQNVKLKKGERAEFRDKDGKLIGELRQKTEPSQGLLPGMVNDGNQYYWGNKNKNEWTKPWDKHKGGDGLLAWDLDKDGKITSGKELFGHVDTNGKNRFDNGYEKLATYFDKDGNGVVEGGELDGLKIWEDRNGDGVTHKGELVDVAERGVRAIDTRFDPSDMSVDVTRD